MLTAIMSSVEFLIFLTNVSKGNYNVKVTAVGMEGNSMLTIKTESRRLAIKDLEIPDGEIRKQIVQPMQHISQITRII